MKSALLTRAAPSGFPLLAPTRSPAPAVARNIGRHAPGSVGTAAASSSTGSPPTMAQVAVASAALPLRSARRAPAETLLSALQQPRSSAGAVSAARAQLKKEDF
ncbi:hypothetical protein CF319_g7516 [Tilletia indica]|nr:hypothetical protein CF319_g7516 [Tilletia indica]